MEEGTGMHPPAGDKRTKALGPKPHYHYFDVYFPLGSDMYINLNAYPQRTEGISWELFKIGELLHNLQCCISYDESEFYTKALNNMKVAHSRFKIGQN